MNSATNPPPLSLAEQDAPTLPAGAPETPPWLRAANAEGLLRAMTPAACDCCDEPSAWEVERINGAGRLMLCEDHARRWQMGEAELAAELEEMAGRAEQVPAYSALFGLQRALDGRTRKAG